MDGDTVDDNAQFLPKPEERGGGPRWTCMRAPKRAGGLEPFESATVENVGDGA